MLIFKFLLLADNQAFEYEKYFEKEIEKKKMDHSYRVFKKVMRDATKFPAAKEFSFFPKVILIFIFIIKMNLNCLLSSIFYGLKVWHNAQG